MSDLAWLDATAQAELVRSGQASPKELVDAAIERLQKLDPQLGVLVTERFEAARAEAAGELPDGPLRGVPMLFKDLGCLMAGDPMWAGTRFAKEAGWRSPDDSHLSRLFRGAGLVPLGRSNVPEFGTTVTTEPVANGPCRNPWNTAHSTGGSSGGSAAAVAAGLVPIAHATDGGGSIRIPASECGVVGLKPSRGRVSKGPQTGESWAGATIDGVVSRSVRDTATALDAISVPMPGDPYWAPPFDAPLASCVGRDPGRRRIGVVTSSPLPEVTFHPDVAQAMADVARLLADLGHDVSEEHPAALTEAEFGLHFVNTIAADMAWGLDVEWAHRLGREIRDDELEPRNVVYRHMGRGITAAAYLQTRDWLNRYTRRMASWWEPAASGGAGFDVLVTPTLTAPPPELGWLDAGGDVGEAGRRITSLMPFTPPFNVSGQPAVSLPLHWTADGLPVGVQFVAAYAGEPLLVRLASQLEQARPWADRRPPVSAG